ncbi:hypothetical protein BHM03_00059118, partial [Ensete ventricosum]
EQFHSRAPLVALKDSTVSFSMADQEVTLVLCASWFSRSSWILMKEITAIRVYGCRAFTSP